MSERRVIVYPPSETGGRRVRIDDRILGTAYSLHDLTVFLARRPGRLGRTGCRRVGVDRVARRRARGVGTLNARTYGGRSACQRACSDDSTRSRYSSRTSWPTSPGAAAVRDRFAKDFPHSLWERPDRRK